ncbi:hypothetical protein HanIR_Chr16g0819011 [Helianthus annuus]|nr:hypothetical protein HanIR_Chr16g0819011 [Helianthus annuus]
MNGQEVVDNDRFRQRVHIKLETSGICLLMELWQAKHLVSLDQEAIDHN